MAELVDEASWPLVTVTWRDAVDEETMRVFLGRMDGWLARRERFGLVLDSRGAKGVPPEARRLLIAHMKDSAALTAEYLVQAIVLDNLIQRTVFYGINLIFPNPFPSRVFAELGAARDWVLSELAQQAK